MHTSFLGVSPALPTDTLRCFIEAVHDEKYLFWSQRNTVVFVREIEVNINLKIKNNKITEQNVSKK